MDSLADLPVNIADMGVIAVLLIAGVIAYVMGFVRVMLSFLAWAGALAAAMFGYPHVQPFARDMIPYAIAADFAAAIVLFIAAVVILTLITGAVAKRVRSSSLNALDRSLGFVFGLALGALLLCGAYRGLDFIMPEKKPEWLAQSRTAPLIDAGSAYLVALIPAKYGGTPMPPAENKGKAVIQLLQPPPKAVPPAPDSDGYDADARSGLERLIEPSE